MESTESQTSPEWQSFPEMSGKVDESNGETEYKVEGFDVPTKTKTLYARTWKVPEGELKARMIYVHGYSDHCNGQGTFFEDLAKQGIEVRSWDQRGWGKSWKHKKERGKSGGTDRVMKDVTGFVEQCPTDVPLYLYGHSMGGGEVLYWASEPRLSASGGEDVRLRVRGYVAEAPLIKVAPETDQPILAFFGQPVSRLIPHVQKESVVEPERLTHDTDEDGFNARCLRDRDLVHFQGTLQGLNDMVVRGKKLHSGAKVPEQLDTTHGKQALLILYGTGDTVVNPSAIEHFANNVVKPQWEGGLVRAKAYPKWKHVLHCEKYITMDGVQDPNYADSATNFRQELINWMLNEDKRQEQA